MNHFSYAEILRKQSYPGWFWSKNGRNAVKGALRILALNIMRVENYIDFMFWRLFTSLGELCLPIPSKSQSSSYTCFIYPERTLENLTAIRSKQPAAARHSTRFYSRLKNPNFREVLGWASISSTPVRIRYLKYIPQNYEDQSKLRHEVTSEITC